eukprot:gnl/MRDRNA2_/MRDRNA2_81885_c0_seq1.p1 gnl/MRDRNA2_/MRDRNA2_81885_c0~~gnl/MRDRNA2_/MRDRNA2_81885_c0_seq1.p1  ORF type:complete len:598 (-),score=106.44 gnl/MRDRNA2_/MRDRNA2_81885_c0_seq1:226-2019(-)
MGCGVSVSDFTVAVDDLDELNREEPVSVSEAEQLRDDILAEIFSDPLENAFKKSRQRLSLTNLLNSDLQVLGTAASCLSEIISAKARHIEGGLEKQARTKIMSCMLGIVDALNSSIEAARTSGHVRRVCAGVSLVIHGFAFELKDGAVIGIGTFLADDGTVVDLSSWTKPPFPGWTNLDEGERIVRVSGSNSKMKNQEKRNHLCGKLTLHTNFGRDLDFSGTDPASYSSDFDVSAPDGKEIVDCVFSDGVLKRIKVISSNACNRSFNDDGDELATAEDKVEAATIATCDLLISISKNCSIAEQKHSLLQVRQLGVTDKLESSLQLLKQKVVDKMSLPEYWDMDVMEASEMKDGQTFKITSDDHTNLLAIVPLPGPEVEKLQALFDASFHRKYTRDRKGGKVPDRLVVEDAKYIQNAQNWTEYKARGDEIKEQLSQLRDAGQTVYDSVDKLKTAGHLEEMELDSSTNAVFLFHGTSEAGAAGITQEDFHINKAGTNAGTLYGRGIYLAESCAKSDEYSREGSDGCRYMLICRVMLGNVHYTDEANPDVDRLVRSCVSGPYHSVLGDREKCRGTFREFIVYDEDQVYPEYLVRYKRSYK